MSKNILWISWKDINHPKSGGAELFTDQYCQGLLKNGYRITKLTSSYEGAKTVETVNGIEIHRVGFNRYLHSFQALLYYLKNFRNKFDVIIEEVNTAPYFITLFEKKAQKFQLYHQLSEEVWNYEARFPLNLIGRYLLEPIALRIQSFADSRVLTVSDSTKQGLIRHGFKDKDISIISEGTLIKGLEKLEDASSKYAKFTLLYFGAFRAMKRVEEVIKAFNEFNKLEPGCQLIIAGSGTEKEVGNINNWITKFNLEDSVQLIFRPTDEQKIEIMQKSHVVNMTSIKEGWGIVVIEAGINGTPAVVYDVDGLRDAVKNGVTGYIVKDGDFKSMATSWQILKNDELEYNKIRNGAWILNSGIKFENGVKTLIKLLNQKDDKREIRTT